MQFYFPPSAFDVRLFSLVLFAVSHDAPLLSGSGIWGMVWYDFPQPVHPLVYHGVRQKLMKFMCDVHARVQVNRIVFCAGVEHLDYTKVQGHSYDISCWNLNSMPVLDWMALFCCINIVKPDFMFEQVLSY